MIVKICGLMSPSDAVAVSEAGADWAGMVFHPRSKRCLNVDSASVVKEALDPGVASVAVVVDRDPSFVRELADLGLIDMVQVHANRDPVYLRAITDIGLPVIRAFVVSSRADVEEAASCEADHVMLDAGMGSGRRFDLSLVEDAGFDFILSGGLDPENVSEAITLSRPIGVDVSSGVETEGRKDPGKIREFVWRSKQALRRLASSSALPILQRQCRDVGHLISVSLPA